MKKRLTLALALAVTVVMLLAPSALAQRDPFAPPIEAGEAVPGAEQPAPPADPNVAPAPQTPEELSNTGIEGGPWLAVAYALVALGLGMVVLTRIADGRRTVRK